MVFMDGSGYAKTDGAFRVPVVFDNLIHQKAMPVTIAVFVNPGTIPASKPGAKDRSNRSFEYDSLGDQNAKFLTERFLPVVLKGLNVSQDPKDRAICGISSSGIAAFTVAWERPDQFGKVLSHIGSFTNIRGGWAYPGLVRQTKDKPKPIKVYLQEGKEDLNNLHGNWPLGNQDLAAALQFAGYPYKLVMTEGGHSGKWGGEDLPNALRWLWASDSESTQLAHVETKPEWTPHPDAVEQPNIPHGTIEQMPPWESKIFASTVRDWSIYVPAQYKPEQPAAVMIFQDGERMKDVKGRWRVPVVFDNLIARGDMPPTIAVFINPGNDPSKQTQKGKQSNRGFEYDSLGDRYVRFLLEEILPEVEKKYRISSDPEMRAIGGSSSGAICAFTAAWERTDQFRKVYSSVGSFTNLRGGNVYPSLVRKTEPKPIRIYMADTSGDVDNQFGSWPWSNQLMASALTYMGYDVRFDWAEGYAHNADYGGSRFPEAMKWLWRKEKHQPFSIRRGPRRRSDAAQAVDSRRVVGAGGREPGIRGRVLRGCRRELLLLRHEGSGGLPDQRRRWDADRNRERVRERLEFGPDGLLYGCQGAQNRVISINLQTKEVKTVATGVKPNDLAVSKDGFIYITETGAKQVTRIDIKSGSVFPVDKGINLPNGIALTNDEGSLAVSDYGGDTTWLFRVDEEGTLDAKTPTMPMRLPIDPKGEFKPSSPPPYQKTSNGDGMAVDKAGRFYVTSNLVCRSSTRRAAPAVSCRKPNHDQPLTTCILAGADHSILYIGTGLASIGGS